MAWWFSGGGGKAIINVMSVWQTGLELRGGGLGCTEGMDAYTRVRMGLQPMRSHNRYLAYTCATHKCAPVHHTRPRWTRLKKVIRGCLSSAVFVYLPLLRATVRIDDSTFDRPTYSSFFFFFLPLSLRATLRRFPVSAFRNHTRNFYSRNEASRYSFGFSVNHVDGTYTEIINIAK